MSPNDVQLLLADVAIIIILARLLGIAAERLGQPPVLGEILAGILLGPTFFHGRITTTLFPATLIPPLTALADIGLVLFMFVVGYEVDLRLIRGRERAAFSVSIGSVALPLALGSGLGVWLAHRNHLHHVSTFALFIGTAMAATAFPVLARILTDRGLHRTRIGGLALGSAAVADVLAWSLLAVVVALAGSSPQWRIVLAIPYAAVMFLVVRPLLRRLARAYQQAGRLTPSLLHSPSLPLLVTTAMSGPLLRAIYPDRVMVHDIAAESRPEVGTGSPRRAGAAQRSQGAARPIDLQPPELRPGQKATAYRTGRNFGLIRGCDLAVLALGELLQVQQLPPGHDQVADSYSGGGPPGSLDDHLEQQARRVMVAGHEDVGHEGAHDRAR